MKAVILCAGKGTRLYPLTHTVSKALIPVANRPIVAYLLDALVNADIFEVGIVTDPHQTRHFKETLANWTPRGVRVTFIEQNQPLGLAHAVACARDFVGSAPFVVMLGDNIFTWRMAPLVERFRRDEPDVLLLAMHVPDPRRYGVLKLSGSRVVDLQEKPESPASDMAIVGMYFLKPLIFAAIADLAPSHRGELEITDAIERLVRAGYRVEAEPVPGWCQDVGTLESLLETNRLLLDELATAQTDGARLVDTEVQGRVRVDPESTVSASKLRGPLVIGPRCVIQDSFIGPFTSVGGGVRIRNSVLEHSIVLQNAAVEHVSQGIRDSLIGRNTVIKAGSWPPNSHQIIIGDDGRLTLSDPRWGTEQRGEQRE